ncbi:hypothetical protein B0J15DRAFT_556236 [Fusarium solani]|uniref:Uncharacterized protein n=1 Tax=Fusarium solani TaxID=169388 RepID=A0A9P9FY67_FUSSL|nr:uncharacterized protein B0J15DRAFT_556236 [Fusarium solani]KAH7228622.1 hypothetical protein B0J15DRAFT_556236 [Fusarium solani]
MEESTYFCYAEGINADCLRLGSLVFDYANPRTRIPHIHKPSKNLLDDPPQAAADERPTCYMAFERGKSNSFGAGLKQLLEFDHSRAGNSYCLVVGKNGSKIELNSPENYFSTVILKDQQADLWLRSRLSVFSRWDALRKRMSFRPKIWMLTGIFVIKDAFYYTTKSKEVSTTAKSEIPIPEPTGIAELLDLKVGLHAQLGSSTMVTAGGQILGERVWAAQWQKVDARVIKDEDWGEIAPNRLRLLPLRTQAVKGGPEVAELSLEQKRSLMGSDGNETLVDEADAWQEFEKDAQSIEKKLESLY